MSHSSFSFTLRPRSIRPLGGKPGGVVIHAVERFLADVHAVRATGSNVPETSFYPALSELLNEIGRTLTPRVRCVIQLRNRGAGLPDGGLFTAEQFKRKAKVAKEEEDPFLEQIPARGVIEAKPAGDDLRATVESEQVERYWKKYGLVLVTNFRSFALVGKRVSGRPTELETFVLAESEDEFWKLAAHPRAAAVKVGDRLVEYLRRVLLHNAPLSAPHDVAALLASYARDAKARIEEEDLPALQGLRGALEEALGLRFQGPKGEHFFRSSLVQTLFYGIFSAWVIWARRHLPSHMQPESFKQALRESREEIDFEEGPFDWRRAGWLLRVPMIRALFEQVAAPSKLDPLGLIEVLDWTAAALNRVDNEAFFAAFDEGHAVQYFYEPFLQAFDPELRKDLGVWFTPPEIVEYQVARVDTVLREELDIPDGLADPRVVVLDPCCGTGAYLRSVLDRIARTLREKGGDALIAHDLKKAAKERVFGFEILPAPFVIAHLQIGLLLETLGAPLRASKSERVGVFLTNALTGWEPLREPKNLLPFPELQEERDAAEKVKREAQILVVLGNPPYNGFAGAAIEEERDLTQAYRQVRTVAPPQGQGLNDLFVRFFRMAERRIVEKTGRGIVCFISNYSWLDGLSFTGMREKYLEVFDHIAVDCLNGDKYKTGKLTPEGNPDPSVFSTEASPEGIQVGTAIALLVRKDKHRAAEGLRFRHLWGRKKREQLRQEAEEGTEPAYDRILPQTELGLPFFPATTSPGYTSWPLLPELFPVSFPGVQTSRDEVVVDIDRERLVERMRAYFNPDVSDEEMRRIEPQAMAETRRFKAVQVRRYLLRRGFRADNVVRFHYRPFDVRWLYWESETKLLDEKREDYTLNVFEGNPSLSTAQRHRREFDPPFISSLLFCRHIVERGANIFPLYVRPAATLDNPDRKPTPNLSERSLAYLARNCASEETLLYHTVTILHSPSYRKENSGALRQDWPRIPLPKEKDRLLASADLGRTVAALLDVETPVPGVTEGTIREDLRSIAVFTRADGRPANPDAGDLDLTVGWGHAGKGNVTMPGKGKIAARGEALDIYLNDMCYWSNIPKSVWEYTIGGYQVIKKWLSYREKSLLGRGLTIEEIRYVTEMTRRIAALIALGSSLDANYRAVIEATYPWPGSSARVAVTRRAAARRH